MIYVNFLLRLKILYCALADVTFIVFKKNSQSSGSGEQGCVLNVCQLQKKNSKFLFWSWFIDVWNGQFHNAIIQDLMTENKA